MRARLFIAFIFILIVSLLFIPSRGGVAQGVGSELGKARPQTNDSSLASKENPDTDEVPGKDISVRGGIFPTSIHSATTPLQNVVAIATGGSHTCALTNSGGVKCWGWNESGQLGNGTTIQRSAPVGVVGLTIGITAIAAGSWHTCALTSGGGVKCWGRNDSGQLGDGTTIDRSTPVDANGLTSGVMAIAAGRRHTCALTSGGGVKCWGSNWYGQLGDGTTTNRNTPVDVAGLTSGVISIAAGSWHTCALTSGGGVKCWGANGDGQLGGGTDPLHNMPVDVNGLAGGVTSITAGYSHTCALTSGGGVKCWGWNDDGQLGDGTFTSRKMPADVNGLTSGVIAIAAGGSHSCALTSSGGVKCWGKNASGQLGDGTTIQRSTPMDVVGLTSGVIAVAAGGSHTCALTIGGEIECWGWNDFGQLGDGTTIQRSTPVDVSGLTIEITAIAAGGSHTCALTMGGKVACWGANEDGQLGDGTTIQRSIPVDVNGPTSGVTIITAGDYHTCVLTSSGGVKCWGWNEDGQLGDGTTTSRSVPVDVAGLTSGVTAIAAGYYHTCVLTSSGGVKCWGWNGDGQLGDGTTIQRSTPVDVSGLTSGVTAIAAGDEYTCALTSGGGVKCWGANGDGQLGDGTTTQRSTPVDVSGLTSGVTAITAGGWHTCVLTTGGGGKCWGANWNGQLGDGTTTQRSAPVDVSGLASGIIAIAAGDEHTCALTTGGGVKCWGWNDTGQLGDSTTTNRSTPVDVFGLTNGVTAIAAGGSHNCALSTGGGAKCWGWDGSGQLGIGTTTQRLTPVIVVESMPASLVINYTSGRPGSLFTLIGENFLPNGTATVVINGRTLTNTLIVESSSQLVFLLDTTQADEGHYSVTATVNPSATARFVLDSGEPLRPQEGSGPILDVPGGIAFTRFIYLPLIQR
jgi:alpha-tubulin suppressor-like RCC1 family protein